MRKENKLTKVAIFALLIAIVAIVLVSGTYARYTTSLTGTDSVQIAKWAWNISGADIDANTTSYTLDLFSTIKDTATYGTTNEANVIDGKIAMPEDNIPTTHIIKTALPKYVQSIQNEYICMK